ncbi:hypothetical protein AOQ84DRAFT_372972 [Glonium stellatum]|uniref:Uncharacterized protein n=1 Tax=Glonium stellatum TaxID=574774 RepID=A0A8E2F8V4_9PEZI|nr:hypothetical protein AOQ84DRAFT_372972 [Glonium stellatum]
MSHLSGIQPWLIHDLETCTNSIYNQTRSDFCNAAEYCNWEQLFSILHYVQRTYQESWVNCPISEDGWTPLHYAAYENTPISTINRLLSMEAWRSLQTVSTAGTCLPNDTMTAFGIAKALNHTMLYDILSPVIKLSIPVKVLWRLQNRFHQLICDMGWSNDDITRLPELSVLKEGNGYGWFPVRPGVNGEVRHKFPIVRHNGYLYRLSRTGLLVWSCSENGSSEG